MISLKDRSNYSLNHNLREKIIRRHYRDNFDKVINQFNNEIEFLFNYNNTIHMICHRTPNMITTFTYENDGYPDDILTCKWMMNDIAQIEMSNRIEYFDERCVSIGLNLSSFDISQMEKLGDMLYEDIDKLLKKFRFK